jgi:hypothetical protein
MGAPSLARRVVMSLAVEFDALLQEIRDLRDRRQLALQHDLAEIDRAYEQDLHRLREAARKHTLAVVALGSTLAVAAVGAWSLG